MLNMNELVIKARQGDKDAIEQILEKFKPALIKYSRSYYIKDYDMEDLMQMGRISIIKAVFKFDLDKNKKFENYAISAIINNFKAMVKEKIKYNAETSIECKNNEGIPYNESLLDEFNIEEDLCNRERDLCLKQTIMKLDEKYIHIIIWLYFKDGSLKEYSEYYGIDYRTCLKRKQRALKKLREIYKE